MGVLSRSGVRETKGDLRMRILTAPGYINNSFFLPAFWKKGSKDRIQTISKGPPLYSLLGGHISSGLGAAMSCREVV